jgi:hypothetical protein
LSFVAPRVAGAAGSVERLGIDPEAMLKRDRPHFADMANESTFAVSARCNSVRVTMTDIFSLLL